LALRAMTAKTEMLMPQFYELDFLEKAIFAYPAANSWYG